MNNKGIFINIMQIYQLQIENLIMECFSAAFSFAFVFHVLLGPKPKASICKASVMLYLNESHERVPDFSRKRGKENINEFLPSTSLSYRVQAFSFYKFL